MDATRDYGTVGTEGHEEIGVRVEGKRVIVLVDGTRYPLVDPDDATFLANMLLRANTEALAYAPTAEG